MDQDICFWKHIKPSDNPGWSLFDISRGDIRHEINRNHSIYTQRFLHIEKKRDGIHTVIWIKDSEIERWRKCKGIAAIRNCIGSVLSEEDGRRLFPTIYRLADEVKERRKLAARMKKLQHGLKVHPPEESEDIGPTMQKSA